MKKLIHLFLLAMLVGGCATTLPKPTTKSVGDPDLAKYETFTALDTERPNTPQSLRNQTILRNLIFRLHQEGFNFVNSLNEADFVVTTTFLDKVVQRYIPPSYHSISKYNTATDSVITTTQQSGGYAVPQYAISIAVNIYDRKEEKLIWSGAGASPAVSNMSGFQRLLISVGAGLNPNMAPTLVNSARRSTFIINIEPYVDNIILGIIDDHLITPAYINDERDGIRKKEKQHFVNEFLKPVIGEDKLGYYKGTIKDEFNGAGIILSLNKEGSNFVLMLSLKNNTSESIIFDPTNIKTEVDGERLTQLSKSVVASAFFKSGNKKRDEAVRNVYKNYLEKKEILSNEHYLGYLYIVSPLDFKEGEMVKIEVPIVDESYTANFVYEKGYLTKEAYVKLYGGK